MSNNSISFDWSSPIIREGVHYPEDNLGRKKYAEFLHNYLACNASNGGYVLNLNAKWGAGKTYFINRWIESIKNVHPVVYIDAWKQDYSNDPMLTVVSSLLSALSEHLPKESQHVSNISEKSARFIKALAPALMKGLVKKTTGVNLDDISYDSEEPELQDGAKQDTIATNSIAEASGSLVKCLIDEHNSKLKSVQHLRNGIKEIVNAVVALDNELKVPAFVFIDELDRCRPSYAVEMLEVVKHFFELDNIVFVITTDTEQLQHAVKAVYGEGFDAQTYLGRFFRRRYSLNEMSRYQFINQIVQTKVTLDPKWGNHIPRITELPYLSSAISIVANHFELSLRDTEQLLDRFVAVLNNANKTMNPYLLLILFVLRDKHTNVYQKWVDNLEKFRTFDGIGDNLKDDVHAFHVSNKGEQNGSYPIDSPNAPELKISYKLGDILTEMNVFTLPWEGRTAHEFLQGLDVTFTRSRSQSELMRTMQKQFYYDLTAKKLDYKNWVELAVSFEE